MRSRIPIIVAALVLLAAPGTFSAQACVHAGLEAGLNQSKATLTSDIGLPEPGYRPAWSAGVTLDVPLAPKLTLATGLRYLEYGEQVTASIASFDGGARFERHLVWRYLVIPAQVRVHLFPVPGLYLAAGPEAGYLLTTWHQDHVWLTSGPVLPPLDVAAARPQGEIFEEVGAFFADPHGAYSRWNLALSSALGCEVPLGGHSGRIEARYTHGLVDIAKSDVLKRSTRGFELLAGARW
jgi:hypothetical protein